MNQDLLRTVATQIGPLRVRIASAQDAINLLREAGEDFAEQQVQLDEASQRLARWESTLALRGIEVPEPESGA